MLLISSRNWSEMDISSPITLLTILFSMLISTVLDVTHMSENSAHSIFREQCSRLNTVIAVFHTTKVAFKWKRPEL